MEPVCDLQKKIDKIERDHQDYVQFGAGCFIGIFAIGIMIDHLHEPLLWLVLLALTVSLVISIVIAVKQGLKKDKLIAELEALTLSSAHSNEHHENTLKPIQQENNHDA